MAKTRIVPTASDRLIAFPAYQLLVVEERLREQEAEGVRVSEGMERDELALRVLIGLDTIYPSRQSVSFPPLIVKVILAKASLPTPRSTDHSTV
jgi:hypothetical protein